MINYTKTNIRLNKIKARSLKQNLKWMSTLEKQYCKAQKNYYEQERFVSKASATDKWQQTKWGQMTLERLSLSLDKLFKIREKIFAKYSNKTEDDVEQYLAAIYRKSTNSFYGGSY